MPALTLKMMATGSSERKSGSISKDKDRKMPLGETLSPILALLNTRSARGYHAEDFIKNRVKTIRFQLTHSPDGKAAGEEVEEALLPLGWMLSPDTQKRIIDMAKQQVRNKIEDICKLMKPDADCTKIN